MGEEGILPCIWNSDNLLIYKHFTLTLKSNVTPYLGYMQFTSSKKVKSEMGSVKKPDKYQLSQLIRVTISIDKSC